MLRTTQMLGMISGLIAAGMASSASAFLPSEFLLSVEAGYARFHHSNSLDHYETGDVDINHEYPEFYERRHLADNNGFYLRMEARPLESPFGFGVQYLQTGHNHLNVSRNVEYAQGIPSHLHRGDSTYKLDTKHQALLAMVYFYPLEPCDFVPYIGAGVGVSRNKVSKEIIHPALYLATPSLAGEVVSREGRTRTVPAWALQVGGRYYLHEDMYLNANYQFIDFGEVRGSKVMHDLGETYPSEPANLKGHLRDHTFMVGVGYQF